MSLLSGISRVIDYVFYRSERIGRFGKPFTLWKLRTMCHSADTMGGASASEDDPRITRIGKYLRQYKIDELPQLINIIKGDMAIVGPRPEVKYYVDMLTEYQRKNIFSVRPGITDFASIYFYNEDKILVQRKDPEAYYRDVIRPKKVELQIEYVKNKSFWLDIKIVFWTIWTLIRRKRCIMRWLGERNDVERV